MTILSRLFLLVAVALLPAIADQIYTEFDVRRLREIEVQDQALSLAKLAAAEQLQIVQGIRQVLVTLSELPAIKAKDSDACDAYFTKLKQKFPAFLTFLAADTNGRPFCNSEKKPINIAARPYFISAMETGAFTVGEYSTGLSAGRKAIQFALPFHGDDGHIAGVIVAGLSLDWLADYLSHEDVPKGAALAVTDRKGTYLARYPDNARYVGQKMIAKKFMKLDRSAAVDMISLDGVERIVGFSSLASEEGGIGVSFGLNRAKAFANIQQHTEGRIFLIALSTALALFLAIFGARRFIHQPLGKLVDAANQWRLGNFARRVSIRERSEIGRVADAFNTMADALEQREHELHDAKERAEKAAARIKSVFESTTDSVLIIDRDWRISYSNARAKDLLDRRRDLTEMDLWEAFGHTADTNFSDRLHEAMSTRQPIAFETLCREKHFWLALNVYPSDQGLAIYFRDITETKRALEAHHRIEEQLHQSQKMEAVGQLTGGIAHDFNNLLTVVAGNLELIGDRTDDDRLRQLAASAQHAADRGATLIGQLLAFSRRQKLKPELLKVSDVVREFHGLIRRAIGEGCEITLLTDEPLWACHLDPAQLQTAVLNLVLNGHDAMPDGGVLEIETRNVVVTNDDGPGCPPGSYVRLSVSDTGSGMSAEVLARACEPFFTTKEIGKGTGLGLSMVYGFVQQSGGHVVIESSVGVGTTVTLYLPKAQQESDNETLAIQVPDLPAGSERVLVVEDDESVLGVTSEMLADLGYRVSIARSGTEAMQILNSGEEFELLFSDIVMPQGMNGVELAREAKRLKGGIKVLLTSGYARDILERHGAVDEFAIIGKPFRRADLAQSVRSALQEQSTPPCVSTSKVSAKVQAGVLGES